jgi:hypothetical protein
MTLKEKAHELFDKYNELLSFHILNGNFDVAKQCAILSVDEILDLLINVYGFDEFDNGKVNYWQEVKEEILKL